MPIIFNEVALLSSPKEVSNSEFNGFLKSSFLTAASFRTIAEVSVEIFFEKYLPSVIFNLYVLRKL